MKQTLKLPHGWKPILLVFLAVLVVGGGSTTAVALQHSFLGVGPQMPALCPAQAASPSPGASPDPVPTGDGCTPTTTPIGMLRVQGTQIVDSLGHAVILRGAQIESAFTSLKQWKSGIRPTSVFTHAVLEAMSQKWRMNVLRIPVSNWILALNPAEYLHQLDQVVAAANAAGLYVILVLHDSAQSGSPFGRGANVPKAQSLAFWRVIAAHYQANPMILLDAFNEPQVASWQQWLHGGGTVGGAPVVGFSDLVRAIRASGARQLVVLEPGSAGKGAGRGTLAAEKGGWSTFPAGDVLTDANTVYSLHVYDGIADPAAIQDAKWGSLLGHHPLLYGEYAFLPNSSHPGECRGVAHARADSVVSAFLNYMDARGASWVAWDFAPFHLIQDTTTFAPTTLDMPWTCGDVHSHAGMGEIVLRHLWQLAVGTEQSGTPTAAPST